MSKTGNLSGKHPFFLFVCAAACVSVLFCCFTGLMLYRYGKFSKDFGWTYSSRGGDSVQVVGIDPLGPAAGKLRVKDRIISIDGDTRYAHSPPYFRFMRIPPGGSYTVRISRDGAEQDFTLAARLKSGYENLGHMLFMLVMGISFCGLSLLIGISRPDLKSARLATLTWLSFSFVRISNAMFPIHTLFNTTELGLYWLIEGLSFDPLEGALAYHFYYRFPSGIPKGKFWSILKYGFYTFGIVLSASIMFTRFVYWKGEPTATDFYLHHSALMKYETTAYSVFWALLLISICAVIVRNYRLVSQPDQRHRIRWVLYGSAAGLAPAFLYFLSGLLISPAAAKSPFYTIQLLRTVNVFLLLIPATIGYAILKHRIFDINIVIRTGLQYLLAKNVLRILLWLPMGAMLYTILSNPSQTVAQVILHNYVFLLAAVAAGASLKFRAALSQWLDRKFFRDAYDREKMLERLIEQIGKLGSMQEISALVSKELDSALHPDGIYVFYRQEETRDLALGHSSGSLMRGLRIPETSQLLAQMESNSRPQELSLDESLSPADRKWIEPLAIRLIVPMLGSDRHLVGLLLLGGKKSEEPYTRNDRALLQSLATQIGVLFEMLWLKGEIHKERKIKREVLAHLEEGNMNLLKECPRCGTCYDSRESICIQDGAELSLSLPVDRTIEGKYRLEKLIGKGGMGAVYEATDLRLGRKVAIKVLPAGMFGNRDALRRFEREAQASARLNHPNIITVYDYGTVASEGAFLVMELLRGFTLRSDLRRLGNLHPQETVAVFHQIMEGVKTAHGSGIIHRDLKPENILVVRDDKLLPAVKILDFGLAKLRVMDISDLSSLTLPGAMIGTLRYMSPEQIGGTEIDERSDIFTLGIMMMEALTGVHPFGARTFSELMSTILYKEVHLPRISEEAGRLDSILQKAIAKNPADRYSSVAEMQNEVIPAIRNCPPFPAPELPPSSDDLTSPPRKGVSTDSETRNGKS